MIDNFETLVDGEKGVYVVCSDKTLLDKINRMLKRQGIVGITDGEGKLHYMVDARKSPAHAARQVNEFVNSVKDNSIVGKRAYIPENVADSILEDVIDTVFSFYDLDQTLLGTRILRFIVRYDLMHGMCDKRNVKEVYSAAGWELNLTYSQVERDVRYALRKSKFGGINVKTMNVIRVLDDAVRLGLEKKRVEIVESDK